MLSSKGNSEVVAPTSAPILQIVPFPVHDIDEVPEPKYSTMWLVPPFTVNSSQTRRITSLGDAQPDNSPVR